MSQEKQGDLYEKEGQLASDKLQDARGRELLKKLQDSLDGKLNDKEA